MKSSFIKVILVTCLNIMVIADSLIFLKPGTNTLWLIGILSINVNRLLLADKILCVAVEETKCPLSADNRGWS